MKKIVPVLKYLVFLSIGGFLLWLAFRGQSIESLMQGFRDANYTWIILALFAGLLSHISRALRWQILVKPLGYNLGFKNSFTGVMIGYIANLAVPRMGEVSRCVAVNKVEKVPVNQLFGTVVTERIIDLLVLIIIMALAFILEFNTLVTFFTQNSGFSLADIITPTLIIIAVSVLTISVFFFWWIFTLKNPPVLVMKFREIMKGFAAGLTTIKKMEQKWAFVFHSVLIWALYFIMIYIGFFALEATSHLTISAALVVFVVGTLGFILPSPGGIGTFHLAVREALYLYEIPREVGVVFATLIHASQTILILVGGTLALIALMFALRKNNRNEPAANNNLQDILKEEIS